MLYKFFNSGSLLGVLLERPVDEVSHLLINDVVNDLLFASPVYDLAEILKALVARNV